MIDNQTTFDTVVTALIKQGKPSMKYLPSCQYAYGCGASFDP